MASAVAGSDRWPVADGLWRIGTGSLTRLVHRRGIDAASNHMCRGLALHPAYGGRAGGGGRFPPPGCSFGTSREAFSFPRDRFQLDRARSVRCVAARRKKPSGKIKSIAAGLWEI